jgi:hypothetical protein
VFAVHVQSNTIFQLQVKRERIGKIAYLRVFAPLP